MNSELFILALDTATLAGSIALSRGARLIAGSTGDPAISHSNVLLADIDRLLSQAGISLGDIELFAVASGPGSFTGLRIGLATVKALATTLNRPCVGVPTLEAIAHSGGISDSTVALLPAGRGEVFVQRFRVSSDGVVTPLDKAAHLPPLRMIENYIDQGSVLWVGEGATKHSDLIRGAAKNAGYDFSPGKSDSFSDAGWRIADPVVNLAQHVASLALLKPESSEAPNALNLRAIYVRPSDAELKL